MKECKDRKWGPAFAEGIAAIAGPQIWIDGRPLRGPSLFRTDTQEGPGAEARPVAIAAAAGNRRGRESGKERGRRRHAMLLLWNGHGVDMNE